MSCSTTISATVHSLAEHRPPARRVGGKAAPHHYGGCYGNYASALAGAIRGFTFVEWDESAIPALDGSAYTVRDGTVTLPDAQVRAARSTLKRLPGPWPLTASSSRHDQRRSASPIH
jgi:hypothetical protein